MSTRGQVFIKDTGVYLYQHSDGYDLGDEVRSAIASERGQARRDDEEYLTRIIFEDMIGKRAGSETGYGIGTSIHGDIEYLVTVDVAAQTVTVEGTRDPGVWDFAGNLVEDRSQTHN
jgi:hypothetical protein